MKRMLFGFIRVHTKNKNGKKNQIEIGAYFLMPASSNWIKNDRLWEPRRKRSCILLFLDVLCNKNTVTKSFVFSNTYKQCVAVIESEELPLDSYFFKFLFFFFFQIRQWLFKYEYIKVKSLLFFFFLYLIWFNYNRDIFTRYRNFFTQSNLHSPAKQ